VLVIAVVFAIPALMYSESRLPELFPSAHGAAKHNEVSTVGSQTSELPIVDTTLDAAADTVASGSALDTAADTAVDVDIFDTEVPLAAFDPEVSYGISNEPQVPAAAPDAVQERSGILDFGEYTIPIYICGFCVLLLFIGIIIRLARGKK